MAFKKKFNGQTDVTIQLGSKDNPKQRDSVEGYYLGTKDIPDSGYGVGKLHIFQTKEGSLGVWGKTSSNSLMTSDLRGQMCRLTFTGMGEKKKGKNPAYMYELEHDPENTISVEGVNVNGTEPEYDDSEDVSDDNGEEQEVVAAPVSRNVSKTTSSQARIQALLDARKKGNTTSAA